MTFVGSVGCGSMKCFEPVAPKFPNEKTPQGPVVRSNAVPKVVPRIPEATGMSALLKRYPMTPV